jgi:hypothetical protein
MRQQLVNLIHLLRRQPHQYVFQITTADALTLLLLEYCIHLTYRRRSDDRPGTVKR